jgi:excisionase family DNA binding protein
VATDTHDRPLLNLKQVAARVSLSQSTLRRKIREGALPAVQLGGKRCAIRVDEAELDRLTKRERAA